MDAQAQDRAHRIGQQKPVTLVTLSEPLTSQSCMAVSISTQRKLIYKRVIVGRINSIVHKSRSRSRPIVRESCAGHARIYFKNDPDLARRQITLLIEINSPIIF